MATHSVRYALDQAASLPKKADIAMKTLNLVAPGGVFYLDLQAGRIVTKLIDLGQAMEPSRSLQCSYREIGPPEGWTGSATLPQIGRMLGVMSRLIAVERAKTSKL